MTSESTNRAELEPASLERWCSSFASLPTLAFAVTADAAWRNRGKTRLPGFGPFHLFDWHVRCFFTANNVLREITRHYPRTVETEVKE